jgi:hypothetical protein
MRVSLALALLLATAWPATSFKFMKNWKVPTLTDIRNQRVASQKFGDKKLVVITGSSSGLGRKTTRALVRTGKYHVRAARTPIRSACAPPRPAPSPGAHALQSRS